jgi:ubiquitin-like 1-activating enzyme E1 B
MSKEGHLVKVLGKETYDKIHSSKVLLVGAGGIGCELLKDLVLLGYGEIHVVDLDTIDLSNLNRQFLFRQKDIKKPKASTAVNAVENFNFHGAKLIPYQASIYETDKFPLSWFDQFDIIFNALDNIAARSYINKIGLFLNKKIMESGTTGTNGQSQPTFPNKTECYDCVQRETPKQFPVCTIRSTPSEPVHCIHWAKSFLFNQIFTDDESEIQPEGKDSEELGTDNLEEIKNLVSESNELIELKRAINEEGFSLKVIDKIFIKDVEKLLLIEDLWKTRVPPTPLNFKSYSETISLVDIKDLGTGQKPWTIEQNLKLFIDSTEKLQSRIKVEKEIEFDKDDEDTLNFVTAATNIRSFIFNIPIKSKFDIKSIAGNIIPATATTNAVIAGFSSLLSLKLFSISDPIQESRAVFTSQSLDKFVASSHLSGPNPECQSCSIPRGVINLDKELTIEDLLSRVIEKYGYDEDLSLSIGSKLLYDLDFDDNKDRKLSELGVTYGSTLNIADETDVKKTVEFYVEFNDDKKIVLPDIVIPDKPQRTEDEGDAAEDDENDEVELVVDEDDDLVILEENPEKRKIEDGTENGISKKVKTD